MKNKSKNLEKQNKDNDLSENKKNTTDKKQEKNNLKNLEEPKKENESNSNKLLNALESNKKKDDDSQDLKQEIENLIEEKLRLLAEMENLRKRSEKEKIDSIKYGSINLARDILPLGDNLSRALTAISSNNDAPKAINNLVDGIKMVQKEFINILEKHGIERIEAMNNKFDHNYHQAILEIEKADCEEGIIVQEIQSGFIMHDRLLRPSMVGVSKKPKNDKE